MIAGAVAGVLALVATVALRLAGPVADPALGYVAKVVCSQVFLGNVTDARALADLPQEPVLRLVRTRIDRAAGAVEASVPLVSRRRAVYRPLLGCTLDPVRGAATAFPALPSPAHEPAATERPWPAGEAAVTPPVWVDAIRLEAALEAAFTEPGGDVVRNTRAVVIVHGGRIIAERYAGGVGAATSLPGWSMTKSVNSALVGVLAGAGRLRLDGAALLPEWRGDGRSEITLEQLLWMSSGLQFDEDYGPRGEATRLLFGAADVAAESAARPLAHVPGTVWSYSSATSNILARIVRDSAAAGFAEYLMYPRRVLFDRIGMHSAVMEPDAAGTFVASSFMYATARDWARFGLLYLRDGVWDGERVLPEGWVAYSTQPAPAARRGRYGAQWWLNAGAADDASVRPMPRLPQDMYWAAGFEGQYVVVVPSADLVVVRLGLSRPEGAWDIGAFMEQVLAAF
jgi:CubicO group peptidase (beta-lactamase class C family)